MLSDKEAPEQMLIRLDIYHSLSMVDLVHTNQNVMY